MPNVFGGREDLEAVSFLQELNETLYAREPGIVSAAEESTAWPGVSRPTYLGGLGFGFKWNMGWMHDTLVYFQKDPVYRRFHHHTLTFSLMYAFSENFVLPLSHDEVVHGKRSLLDKMPGDRWQQFANLRALYALHVGAPRQEAPLHGRRARRVGGVERTRDRSTGTCSSTPSTTGVQALVRDLNRVYRDEPALWQLDFDPAGFRWLEANDAANNVARLRAPRRGRRAAARLRPQPLAGAAVRATASACRVCCRWREALNTDSDRLRRQRRRQPRRRRGRGACRGTTSRSPPS